MKFLLASDEVENSGGIYNFVLVLKGRLEKLGHEVVVSDQITSNDLYDIIWIHSLSSPNKARRIISENPGAKVLFHIHDYRFTCLTGRKASGSKFSPCQSALSLNCLPTHYLKGCGKGVNPIKLFNNFLSKREWLSVMREHHITVLSSYLKEELVRNDIDAERIEVMPEVFRCYPRTQEATETNLNILWAGRLVEEKGVNILLNFLEAYQRWPLEMNLRIVGSGTKGDQLSKRIRELGLSEIVTLESVATPDEMGKHYHWADALLYTSLWPEPFGMVGPEAMSASLKVYCYKTNPSGASVWQSKYTGQCYYFNDIDSLIDMLKQSKKIGIMSEIPNEDEQLGQLKIYLEQQFSNTDPIAEYE